MPSLFGLLQCITDSSAELHAFKEKTLTKVVLINKPTALQKRNYIVSYASYIIFCHVNSFEREETSESKKKATNSRECVCSVYLDHDSAARHSSFSQGAARQRENAHPRGTRGGPDIQGLPTHALARGRAAVLLSRVGRRIGTGSGLTRLQRDYIQMHTRRREVAGFGDDLTYGQRPNVAENRSARHACAVFGNSAAR